MTDSLTLRVRALELDLASRVRPSAIAQTISARTLPAAVTTTINLTAIPAGKLSSFAVPLIYRLPGAGFVNTQIFDGSTQVGSDALVNAGATGGAQILTATMAIGGYTFALVPTLKIYSSVAVPMDVAKLTGMVWQ